MNRFSPTERLGVNAVENIFLQEFNWIPRHILQSDVGIDMEVEVAENGKPTGQLIAIQIKTGESYFKVDSAGDIIYRGNKTHLTYWINHSLPIIIVLHDPIKNKTVWQSISKDTIEVTPKGWKVEIPSTKMLNRNSKQEIQKLNKLPLYFQRLQRLSIHKSLMLKIAKGEKIVIELEQWINKSIAQASIRIITVIDTSNELSLSEGSYIFFKSIEDLKVLFPWADFTIDEDYYKQYDEDNFMSRYGIWDPEEKEYVGSSIDYSDYSDGLPNLRPLETDSGEVDSYRLIFSLNKLGTSFLDLNNYLENGLQLKLDL